MAIGGRIARRGARSRRLGGGSRRCRWRRCSRRSRRCSRRYPRRCRLSLSAGAPSPKLGVSPSACDVDPLLRRLDASGFFPRGVAVAFNLPRAIVRYRVAIAVAWAVVAAALVPFASGVSDRLEASASTANDREAGVVERALVTKFAAPYASFAVLVVTGIPSPATPAGATALRRIIAAVDSAPGVKHVLSYLSPPASVFLSPAGTFV